MKAFEKPLSSEEEKYYVERYRDGDEGAKDILIERNLRLGAHIVKKYQSGNEEMEDLISIGTIGLIKAVTTFDYTKGTRLGTYAARCIDNELLMMLRAKKKMNREVSLYEPMGTDKEGNEINLLDIMEGPNEDVVDRLETDDNVKKLQRYVESCLPGREREIIKMRYGLGEYREMTQREIGEQMGISRSYVSRIEKKALKKLKEEFGYEKKH